MARRRDDEIFKKLNKQKPLVKRKDISPLNSRDFSPRRSSFDLEIEKKSQQKRTGRDKRVEPAIGGYKKTVNRKSAAKKGASLADSYHRTKREAQPFGRQLDIFTDKNKDAAASARKAPAAPVRKAPAAPADVRKKAASTSGRQLDIFADNVKETVAAPAKKPASPPERVRRQQAPTVRRADALRPPTHHKQAVYDKSEIYNVDAASQKKLSFRHELKFYINYRDYILLRGAMRSLLQPDVYTDDNNTYHIRSLYFDDIYESAVKEKMAGVENRSKYRIRIYNFSDDVIRFEKKIKQGQFIAKKSFLLSRSEYDQIIAGEYDFLRDRQEELAHEIYHELKNKMLRPRVYVDYHREAYVSPIENVRITFDKDLKAGLSLTDIFDPHAPVMPMLDKGIMVLEVKFNKFLPEVIAGLVNGMNAANRSAISKYIICRKYD